MSFAVTFSRTWSTSVSSARRASRAGRVLTPGLDRNQSAAHGDQAEPSEAGRDEVGNLQGDVGQPGDLAPGKGEEKKAQRGQDQASPRRTRRPGS